jgi:L-ascorbate metabolism protein UlaG (beta-lactamase superfamily)
VPFVTSLGVGAHLQAWGVPPERITELDWWESHTPARRDLASPPRRRSTSRAAA